MRRHLSIILTVLVVLLVLAGMSAVRNLRLDRPPETEREPMRSTYNTGPTGMRAFYQALEESGYQVARWRGLYHNLAREAADATLVMTGPALNFRQVSDAEKDDLKEWIAAGGQLLVISRNPEEQYGEKIIVNDDEEAADDIAADPQPEKMIDPDSDALITQPTVLTRDLSDLAISRLAPRLIFGHHLVQPPPPSPKPGSGISSVPLQKTEVINQAEKEVESGGPVVHLGDERGAVLADFNVGKGRVVYLSDPFVIANNGIRHGGNLQLSLNLIKDLGGRARKILFDESLHGYADVSNPLFEYFRGTSVFWVIGQLALILIFLAIATGRRFARPLPLPQSDRHSPLEFVDSMASLQQSAHARDLAIENIYPRFRARICRRLGLPARASAQEIINALARRQTNISAVELTAIMRDSENALRGKKIDDSRLLRLVALMRQMTGRMK